MAVESKTAGAQRRPPTTRPEQLTSQVLAKKEGASSLEVTNMVSSRVQPVFANSKDSITKLRSRQQRIRRTAIRELTVAVSANGPRRTRQTTSWSIVRESRSPPIECTSVLKSSKPRSSDGAKSSRTVRRRSLRRSRERR